MKLLLDTHTFVWFINGDKALSSRAKKEILKPTNEKFLSIASIWEMRAFTGLSRFSCLHKPFWKTLKTARAQH